MIPQLARELRARVETSLAPLGLTAQQGAVLMRVALGENAPHQLAALVGTDTAGMTRLLDRLAAKGLIRRRPHPSDRRAQIVEITDQGKDLLPRVFPVFGQAGERLMAGFSADEQKLATELLRRMLTNLHREGRQAI
ncbi:MarR family transcriptional regulator [Nonomuraea sp. NPDC049419]|uniref:MarR family winged helix-turn-helix transcriptional regulator n=1 Tax=Nonomuraea sp. NPDC049419 TaxID=3155772 RepID=UPI00343CCD0B